MTKKERLYENKKGENDVMTTLSTKKRLYRIFAYRLANRHNRVLAAAFSLLLLFALTAPVLPVLAVAELTFTVESTEIDADEVVQLPIMVSGNPGIAILRINITLDSDLAWDYAPASYGSNPSTWPFVVGDILPISGRPQQGVALTESYVSILFMDDGSNSYNNGLLVALKLKVKANAQSGEKTINVSVATCVNEIELNVPYNPIKPATLTVRDPIVYASVSGQIRSYNPRNKTIIQLLQDDKVKYTTIIPKEENKYGIETQEFVFDNIAQGIYTLLITKQAQTSFTVQTIIVGDKRVDLMNDARHEVSLMTLRCGDLNDDGYVNDSDLTILWMAANYNKPAVASANPKCDLNGDGYINDGDLTILWMAYNYNKGAIVIR